MRLALNALLTAIGVVLLAALVPATGLAASGATPLSVDSVSISDLTPTDATLEAQIDTEGLPSAYQFDLWSSPCSSHGAGCELIRTIALPSGRLLGSFAEQTVSLDLNSAGVTLGGGEYGYSVTATSAAGSTQGPWQTFEAPVGVVDPPGPAVSPQAGAGEGAVAGGGLTTAPMTASPAGATTPPAPQTTSSLGTPAKTGAPKRALERKHKAHLKHRRSKDARRRTKTKSHKR